MKRPTIKVALLSMMAAIACATVLLSVVALSSLRTIENASADVGHYWMERLLTAREIKGEFANIRLSLARHVMVENAKDFDAEAESFNASVAALQVAIKKYEKGVRTEKGKALINALKPSAASYLAKAETYRSLVKAGKTSQAVPFFRSQLKPLADEVNAHINELVDFIVSAAEAKVQESGVAASSAFQLTLAIACAVMLLVGFGVYFAIVGIAAPIQRITGAMRRLAEGDKASEVPFGTRADEIGAMASAVEVFRQNALSNDRLEQENADGRSASEARRVAEQQRIAREAEKLRLATSALGENLKRLAAGDLTCLIETEFSEEYEALRSDFNATVDQLARTVGAVSVAVSNMDNGTREIASGAGDLSKRTEQQAASLEETAAALDEITSNVASSSKMTLEARTVAEAANDSAAKSVEVVAHAETAMQRIEESSQQISNIIGVIDEIAFQTNLLALNAGVEAARAGDAGKGFAVVAQEVRELAQRSAQAAKEIKGLIQNSTAEVEGGVKLVRETGIALKSIGDYITQINRHMQSIATSAHEQSTGLSQVNVAVNQMDQTTQQNAAMVEQTTAAASSLSQEAEKLRDLVSLFTLHAGSGQAGALRQTASRMARPAAPESRRMAPARASAGARTATHGNLAVKSDDWQEF